MKIPTGAKDWQRVDCEGERWLALMPNAADWVIAVSEKRPGAWHAEMTEGDLPHAPPVPTGPHATAEEAMHAADAWCVKWAPRLVNLPGIRSLRVCSDGKIRTSAHHDRVCESDTALTLNQARSLAEALLTLADEVGARNGESVLLDKVHVQDAIGAENALLDHQSGMEKLIPATLNSAEIDAQTVTEATLVSQLPTVKKPGIADGGAFVNDPNSLTFREQLTLHASLLTDGWRSTRWHHPTRGEHELVAADRFWYWTMPGGNAGVRWGTENFMHVLGEGRTVIARGEDGHLHAVRPRDGHSGSGSTEGN